MSIGQQILFFLSALGAFNGLLLSFYLFLSRKNRTVPAFFLGLLLLAISIRVAKSVFVSFNPALPKIYLQTGLSFCWLIGPALFYFLRSVLLQVTSWPRSWKIVWILIFAAILLTGFAIPYQRYPHLWNQYIAQAIYLQWGLYLIASGFLVNSIVKKFFQSPKQLTAPEQFLLLVFFGNCFIFLVYLLAFTGIVRGIYLSGAICFSFFLYLTAFFYFQNRNANRVLHAEEIDLPAKPDKKKIPDDEAASFLQRLENLMREKELYKDPNLKLSQLAAQINTSSHYLSQLLNENAGKSFSTYINEFRIDEACRLISTDDRLTLEAIGYEVGYNSKSTFYTAFKKIRNTTPAIFKESVPSKSSRHT